MGEPGRRDSGAGGSETWRERETRWRRKTQEGGGDAEGAYGQSQSTEVNLSQLRYVRPSIHWSVHQSVRRFVHPSHLPILDLLSLVKGRSSSD